uniref:Uncharacterized protein n=1 Tax=Siphoviridae sp. ctqzz19 TaxID=2825682 RepID=A0A8S5U2C4_9CAUD|nr:MAG TPA: hypothetical protein [Siphoviridae sp. ctqzz19]
MKKLDEIRDVLCEELDGIVKGGKLSVGDLDTLHKITDTIKNIYKIEMLETEESYGDWEAKDNYSRDEMRTLPNVSYGRHWVRGHYSRDDFKSHSVRRLKEIAEMADTNERRAIEKAIAEIERM